MRTTLYTETFSLDKFKVYIGATDKGLSCLYFVTEDNSIKNIEDKLSSFELKKNGTITAPYIEDIKALWAKKNPLPNTIKFDLHGTPFQREVWDALLTIQSGETVQYSDIATKIGKPKAVRAAASAIAKNPISILIPCHRVLPKAGGVGQYVGGSDIKKALLQYEDAL